MRHMIFQQHHSQLGLRWEQEEMCQHFHVSACRSGVPGQGCVLRAHVSRAAPGLCVGPRSAAQGYEPEPHSTAGAPRHRCVQTLPHPSRAGHDLTPCAGSVNMAVCPEVPTHRVAVIKNRLCANHVGLCVN